MTSPAALNAGPTSTTAAPEAVLWLARYTAANPDAPVDRYGPACYLNEISKMIGVDSIEAAAASFLAFMVAPHSRLLVADHDKASAGAGYQAGNLE